MVLLRNWLNRLETMSQTVSGNNSCHSRGSHFSQLVAFFLCLSTLVSPVLMCHHLFAIRCWKEKEISVEPAVAGRFIRYLLSNLARLYINIGWVSEICKWRALQSVLNSDHKLKVLVVIFFFLRIDPFKISDFTRWECWTSNSFFQWETPYLHLVRGKVYAVKCEWVLIITLLYFRWSLPFLFIH